MLRYALFDYVPNRLLHRATFRDLENRRRILDFKDGRRYASRWAAGLMALALSAIDMHDVVIACVPGSTPYSHARRYRYFMQQLCHECGALNGYPYITVSTARQRVHDVGMKAYDAMDDSLHIDTAFFDGKKVVLIDDICTTGRSAEAFTKRLQQAGADVCMALFLGRTKRYTP